MAELRNTEFSGDPDRTMPVVDPPAGHALPGGPESTAPALVTGSPAPAGGVSVDGPPPADAGDPEAARQQILQTRARMSGTIDQIEEQLLRRKEQIQERLDVRGQVRERLMPVRDAVSAQPLAALGGVFAAGLLFGYLTGGDDEADFGDARGTALWTVSEEAEETRGRGWRSRARRWERRSRDLMRRNQALEEELREVRERLDRELERDSGGWGGVLGRALGAWFGRRPVRSEFVVEIEEEDVPGDYHPSASYDQFAQVQRVRDPADPLQG